MPTTHSPPCAHVGTAGVTAADAFDAADVPDAFVAVAVNVKATSFVKPVTMQLVAGAVTVQVFVTPPTCGDALTKYVAGVPPVPAATVTVTRALPATAVGCSGVPGAASGGAVVVGTVGHAPARATRSLPQ